MSAIEINDWLQTLLEAQAESMMAKNHGYGFELIEYPRRFDLHFRFQRTVHGSEYQDKTVEHVEIALRDVLQELGLARP